jgi:hypothetical protein
MEVTLLFFFIKSAISGAAEFLDEIPLCYSQSLTPPPLRFIFLQTHATSYRFYNSLLNTVKEKGEKPDRKPYTPSPWFKKSVQKP